MSASEHASQSIAEGRYVVLHHRRSLPAGNSPADRTDNPLTTTADSQPPQRGDHFDWMFEVQGQLLTWASDHHPPLDQPVRLAAMELPPHRLHYLEYQGVLSENRGTVQRVEAGRHTLIEASESCYRFTLRGARTAQVAIYRSCSDRSSPAWVIALEPS